MNLADLTIRRFQRLIGVPVILFLLLGLLGTGWELSALTQLQATVRDARAALETERTAAARLPALREQHQAALETVAALQPAGEPRLFLPTLLTQLDQLANEHGLRFAGAEPAEPAPQATRVSLTTTLRGGYGGLLEFLEGLQTAPQAIAVAWCTATAEPARQTTRYELGLVAQAVAGLESAEQPSAPITAGLSRHYDGVAEPRATGVVPAAPLAPPPSPFDVAPADLDQPAPRALPAEREAPRPVPVSPFPDFPVSPSETPPVLPKSEPATTIIPPRPTAGWSHSDPVPAAPAEPASKPSTKPSSKPSGEARPLTGSSRPQTGNPATGPRGEHGAGQTRPPSGDGQGQRPSAEELERRRNAAGQNQQLTPEERERRRKAAEQYRQLTPAERERRRQMWRERHPTTDGQQRRWNPDGPRGEGGPRGERPRRDDDATTDQR